MNRQKIPNLDRLAAVMGKLLSRLVDTKSKTDVDNIVTKALGILQENGIYACFLYLLAKEKKW